MKISEVFESIQGESHFAGYPVLFIRTSGCTRCCSFCDTQYHETGKEMSVQEIIKRIDQSNMKYVVWSGGEPSIWFKEIQEVIQKTHTRLHHIETNGDLLNDEMMQAFDYVCISPKDTNSFKRLESILKIYVINEDYDIKVVTDLDLNKNMLDAATMLMPLTTDDIEKNKLIEQKVWNYCVEHNKLFCLRQHVHVWGIKKRGI